MTLELSRPDSGWGLSGLDCHLLHGVSPEGVIARVKEGLALFTPPSNPLEVRLLSDSCPDLFSARCYVSTDGWTTLFTKEPWSAEGGERWFVADLKTGRAHELKALEPTSWLVLTKGGQVASGALDNRGVLVAVDAEGRIVARTTHVITAHDALRRGHVLRRGDQLFVPAEPPDGSLLGSGPPKGHAELFQIYSIRERLPVGWLSAPDTGLALIDGPKDELLMLDRWSGRLWSASVPRAR